MSNSQFERFLSPKNFKLAFKRLQTVPRELYKTLYLDDLKYFGYYLNENVQTLIYQIKNKIYKPDEIKAFKFKSCSQCDICVSHHWERDMPCFHLTFHYF